MTIFETKELLIGKGIATNRQFCPQCSRLFYDIVYANICPHCKANLIRKDVIQTWKLKEIWSIIICMFIATITAITVPIENNELSSVHIVFMIIPYCYSAIFILFRNILNIGSFSNYAIKTNLSISIIKNQNEIKNFSENYKNELLKLNSYFKSEKSRLFGKSQRESILNLIEILCGNKEDGLYLLASYSKLFNTDLLEELKKLSSSYDAIKKNLHTFIFLELVEAEFPHERKQD